MRPAGSGVEKRQFGRRQTSLHAWVTVPGRGRFPCLVKDISVGGALLEFEQIPASLPFCFRLTIESTRFETACECRHTRGNQMGVAFVPMELLNAADKRNTSGGVEDWIGLGSSYAGGGSTRTPDGRR